MNDSILNDTPSKLSEIAALRALVSLYSHEYDVVSENLGVLKSLPGKSHNAVTAEALRQLWFGCYGPHTVQATDGVRDSISRDLVRCIIKGGISNLELLSIIARELPRLTWAKDAQLIEQFVGHADQSLGKIQVHEAVLRMELLRHLLVYYDTHERWVDLIRLVELQSDALDRSLIWYSSQSVPWVSISPEYGIESESRLLYGKALTSIGEKARGVSVLRELSSRATRPENRYAVCRAIETLGSIAMEAADTAKYVQWKNRFAGCQCVPREDGVFSMDSGIDTKYDSGSSGEKSTTGYRVPLSVLETTRGSVTLSMKDGVPRVLLITSNNCSVCEVQLPAIARAAIRWNPKVQLYGMSLDETADPLSHMEGMPKHEVILNVQEVSRVFHVRGVPDVRVLLNGQVVVEGATDSSSFVRALQSVR